MIRLRHKNCRYFDERAKDYVDERLEKRETMIVSNGYAWTRPNHIDTAFASADLFEYKLQLAGQTWGYLEFETNTEKYGKVLLIIKGKKRLTNQFPLVQKIRVATYLNMLR